MIRAIPTGTGFYIWQLASVLPVSRLIEALQRAKASWVSIKVADGNAIYNRIDENGKASRDDHFLMSVIQQLQAAGISVGGWQYVYPQPTANPGSQSGLAGERFEKLKLDHWLVDAEHDRKVRAYWITLEDGKANPKREYSATQYMSTLKANGLPSTAACALSSHRFPDYFIGFPFKQFTHGRGEGANDFVAPQVYWQEAHNPGEQLARCLAEYEVEIGGGFTYVPIGSAYGTDKWMPTVEDLQDFIGEARALRCPGWGFWSLDYVMKHNRTDWLDAIAGVVPTPEPPPVPEPVPVEGMRFRVMVDTMNVRAGPGTKYKDIGDLVEGQIVTAGNVAGEDVWIEVEDGKWCAVRTGGRTLMQGVP